MNCIVISITGSKRGPKKVHTGSDPVKLALVSSRHPGVLSLEKRIEESLHDRTRAGMPRNLIMFIVVYTLENVNFAVLRK